VQPLVMWVIYRTPKDYPDCYVARCWRITGVVHATDGTLTADTLEELRAKLPLGLRRVSRHTDDDPVIVETWI
jgi:hypothetical protein